MVVVEGELPTKEQTTPRRYSRRAAIAKGKDVAVKVSIGVAGAVVIGATLRLGDQIFGSDNEVQSIDATQPEPPVRKVDSDTQLTFADILPNSGLNDVDKISFPGKVVPTGFSPSDPNLAEFLIDKKALKVQTFTGQNSDGNITVMSSSWALEKPIPIKSGQKYYLRFNAQSNVLELIPFIKIIPLDENGEKIGLGLNSFDKFLGESDDKEWAFTFPEGTKSATFEFSTMDMAKHPREGLEMEFSNLSFLESSPTGENEKNNDLLKHKGSA